MNPWDDPNWQGGGGEGPGFGINSPVTIVGGERGNCNPCGTTLTLQQVTDYVLQRVAQQQNQGEANGNWSTPGNIVYRTQDETTTVPLKAIGFTTQDGMYELSMELICKVADGSGATLTFTVTYFDILAGSTAVVLMQTVSGAAKTGNGPTRITLLAGSTVTVSVSTSAALTGATYDAFACLLKLA